MDRDFWQMVKAKWRQKKFLCVGLDTDVSQISETVIYKLALTAKVKTLPAEKIIFGFNKAIINATHDLVCAYKPNIAFYEAYGLAGLSALIDTIRYIQAKASSVPIILDAKRGDIGNTNDAYAKAVFNIYGADAVTVNPYLGAKTMKPFLERREKGIFVLCRTSNEGAGEFQDLFIVDGTPFYQAVARTIAKEWNANNNCGLVVGATYPEELAKVRAIIGDDMPILVPGIGTQGGNLKETIKAGKKNMIINAGRSVIFASQGKDFAQAAREETLKLHELVNKYLAGG